MPWYILLALELVKLLIPIITKVVNDPKPNKEASKELITKLRGAIGEPPELKKL